MSDDMNIMITAREASHNILNQRSDRFYNITLVRSSVTQLISETAPRIFPKLGMKLGDNKGKKIAEPFLRKILILPKFGLTCEKMAIFGQNRSFWDIAKKRLQQFF